MISGVQFLELCEYECQNEFVRTYKLAQSATIILTYNIYVMPGHGLGELF
jgi:hypothetical protein